MSRLEVGVGLVLGVPVAIVRQRFDLETGVFAYPIVDALVFVDVISEVYDEIDVFFGQVPQGREVSLLVVLAGCERKIEPVARCIEVRCSSRPADLTLLGAGPELVPVPMVWTETIHLDVDGVS